LIVRSLCNTCLQPYQLLFQATDIDLVKQVQSQDGQTCPCPRLCGGAINLVGEPTITAMTEKLRAPIYLTGKQLYQAINGMGLPDEIESDPLVLKAMLAANKVESTDVELCNGKMYLHEIRLDNGVIIHLGAGARGAQVVKMTKRRDDGRQPPG
jgi:hypothetical protein